MTSDSVAGSFVTTTYKADGVNLCYKMTMALSATGMLTTYADPASAQIGAATSGMTSTVMNVTCASDGQTYAFDDTATGAATCTAGTGTCPWLQAFFSLLTSAVNGNATVGRFLSSLKAHKRHRPGRPYHASGSPCSLGWFARPGNLNIVRHEEPPGSSHTDAPNTVQPFSSDPTRIPSATTVWPKAWTPQQRRDSSPMPVVVARAPRGSPVALWHRYSGHRYSSLASSSLAPLQRLQLAAEAARLTPLPVLARPTADGRS
jgi:hypothetical protein